MMVPHPVAEVCMGTSLRRKKFVSWDRQTSFVCLLLFVWLMTGLLPKWELSKDQWNRCRVLRVKSWLCWTLYSVRSKWFLSSSPTANTEMWFSACEIKIKQNYVALGTVKCIKKGKKNLYMFISNDNSCIFVLVTVSAGYIRHLHQINLMLFF